jgi:hypothetical protein
MDENCEPYGPGTTQIMDAETKKMLAQYGASSSLFGYVRPRIKLSWVHHEPYFHAVADDGSPVTIHAFFDQLKANPNYANQFTPGPQQISQYDTIKLRTSFEKIRSGEVVVADDSDLPIR